VSHLTPESIKSALDALWNKTLIPYDLPWQERHGHISSPRNREGALIYPGGNLSPIPLGVPELDWTVTARSSGPSLGSFRGWRLVIRDGAIRGLEEV
jgi:hypothetical protein